MIHHSYKLLVVIYLAAALIHFIYPPVFIPAIPDFLPFPKVIVFVTGLLEVLLAIGLMTSKFRSKTALLSCFYLVALIPAHIHVSVNEIEMFGVSNTFLLWLRTLFQIPLIYWSYKISVWSKIRDA